MPLPRRGTAAADAAARRFTRGLNYLSTVASAAELSRSGRLQSAAELDAVTNIFEDLATSVSLQNLLSVIIWNDIKTSAALNYFAAAAARWAAAGGGVVEACSAAPLAGGSTSSGGISAAWVRVLTSYGQLLRHLLEASKDKDTAPMCIPMKVVCIALDMDLIPALSRLLASPACAPAAGTAGLCARAAALSVIHRLCSLAFYDPTDLLLSTADKMRARYGRTQSVLPRQSRYAMEPAGPVLLEIAASSSLYEHACQAVRVGAGEADGTGPGAATGGRGGELPGLNRGGLAAGISRLHHVLADIVFQLGRVLLLLREGLGDPEGEEDTSDNPGADHQKPEEGSSSSSGDPDAPENDWAVRTRRSARQILSGTCLQYFLAAHVACQLNEADGGGLYGLPEEAQLPRLVGCAADCACTEKLRSEGMLGAVRCWEQTHTAPGASSEPIPNIYSRQSTHTLCMRLAVAGLASYHKNAGSGAKGRGKEAKGGRRQRNGSGGGGQGEGEGERQGWRPWEQLQLRATLNAPIEVCLESLLAAAAALPIRPVQCRMDVRHWGSDDEESDEEEEEESEENEADEAEEEEEEEEEEQEEGEEEDSVAEEEERRAVATVHRLGRRWWAVAVPAVHAALDGGVVFPRGTVSVLVLQKVLDVAQLPPLEPDLPVTPPRELSIALRAGYLPCIERVLRHTQRESESRSRAVALLSSVASWRRTARLLAYGDVRQAAGLVATVGKLALRLSLPLPLSSPEEHGDAYQETDEDGEPKPVWVPLDTSDRMLAWLAERVRSNDEDEDDSGSDGGSEDSCDGDGKEGLVRAEGGPAGSSATEGGVLVSGEGREKAGPAPERAVSPSAPTKQLLLLSSLAVARWLPHVAAFTLTKERVYVKAAGRIVGTVQQWVPPLVHAYARAVDAGDAAAAVAWRALLLYDMNILAVLQRYMDVQYDRYCGDGAADACGDGVCGMAGQREGGCAAPAGDSGACGESRDCASEEARSEEGEAEWEGVGGGGWTVEEEERQRFAAQKVLLARRGVVRGTGEDDSVELFRSNCMSCCTTLAGGLLALHCVAAALPRDTAEYLAARRGQHLLVCVQGLAGADGVNPRPRLLQLLEKLAEGGGSGGGGEGGGGGGGAGAVQGCSGSGGGAGGLVAKVPDVMVKGRAWSSEVAAQLVAPHSVCAALGVRLCGNPRCEALSGVSELAVPLGGACTRCRAVWYCGRGCQAAHWRAGGHREVCAAAGAAGAGEQRG